MKKRKTIRALIGLAILLVAAGVFWKVVLTPKREKADELKAQVTQLHQGLVTAQARIAEARAAKKAFPGDYRHMVALGKAVPQNDETAALIVSLSQMAQRAKVSIDNISLGSGGESEASPEGEQASPTAPAPEPVAPGEAEADESPLGVETGTGGLDVMSYSVSFSGSYFGITNFLHEVDSLIQTKPASVVVDGRLMTVEGFSITKEDGFEGLGSDKLKAELTINTFVAPSDQESLASAGSGVVGEESIAASPAAAATETATTVETGGS